MGSQKPGRTSASGSKVLPEVLGRIDEINPNKSVKEPDPGDFVCDKCGRVVGIEDLGYLGPKDRDDKSCHPFMNFECLCIECEKLRKDPESFTNTCEWYCTVCDEMHPASMLSCQKAADQLMRELENENET